MVEVPSQTVLAKDQGLSLKFLSWIWADFLREACLAALRARLCTLTAVKKGLETPVSDLTWFFVLARRRVKATIPRSRWVPALPELFSPGFGSLTRPWCVKWEWSIALNESAASDGEMESLDSKVRTGETIAASSESISDHEGAATVAGCE